MSDSEPKTKKRHVDYAETWYRTWCPYCDVGNWHCNGNESDLSGVDVEAIKCRSCGTVYRLGPIDDIMEEIRGDEDVITEDGVHMAEVLPATQVTGE